MIAPVLRVTGTHSRAMKTLDTISSKSKTWPNSLTSSLLAARGRAYFYKLAARPGLSFALSRPPKQKAGKSAPFDVLTRLHGLKWHIESVCVRPTAWREAQRSVRQIPPSCLADKGKK